MATTVIYEERAPAILEAEAQGDELWVSLPEMARVGGWELKPEGVCRYGICIPVQDATRARLLRGAEAVQELNLAEFARQIEQPFAHDEAGGLWYFGRPSWDWRTRLSSQMAPDFELPDFDGAIHRLSDYRGKKVFLLCWSSW